MTTEPDEFEPEGPVPDPDPDEYEPDFELFPDTDLMLGYDQHEANVREIDWILSKFAPEPAEDPGNRLDASVPAVDRMKAIEEKDADQTVSMKKHLAYGAFSVVGLQIFVANFAFVVYARAHDWQIDPEVMIAWLAATVIETLGVVLIIAKNLFPDSGGHQ